MCNEIVCGIYCIFNKVNHKRYIGQSVNIKARWSKHKRSLTKKTYSGDNRHLTNAWHKYGEENFDFFILETCLESELDVYETFWVDYYEATNPAKGYNKTQGGKYNYNIQYDREINPIKYGEDSNYHILSEHDVRQIIKRFECGDSSASIAKQYNVSRKSITNIRNHKMWAYLTQGLNLKQSDFCNTHTFEDNHAKAVDMYTIDGVYIKTFTSINQASEELKCKNSNISKVCYGQNISIRGYVFRFRDCAFDSLKIQKTLRSSPVEQYDLNWNHIQSYQSITEARKKTGIQSIDYALTNSKRTAGGYHWLRKGSILPIAI